ncbi:RagB/SusD family nutrient uptake outer membrane protein [Parabacteroides timonensis]|uniref:RagB/SusD family nutrient uptake outer membrane protein n=1 Tax=Parabacteroides timonensis TaxID=1871013 RepID=UPI00094E4FDF|nr:RagB/SusD family nutrient uptake outer membrane protein [Parabacteroides timonensis]
MKILNKILIGLLSLLCLSACDFLDETAYNKVTVGNFYTTKEGITNGVNGLYSTLRNMYINEYLIYVCEGPSDLWNAYNGGDQWRNWTIDATNGSVKSLWYNCYKSINQCNSVIESLEKNEIPGLNSDLRIRFQAEALFIRAHYYYHLVQQFGDIPMPLEPTNSVETAAYKTSADEVWEQIITDLTFAAKNLPEIYQASEFGHVTRYAAMHHLSRVYLTLNRNDNDLRNALSYAEQVINSGKYSLVKSHAELWDINNKNNSEVLFSVLYTQNAELNGNGNTAHMYFCSAYSEEHPAVKRVIEYGRPWSRERSTDYAINLFDESIDKRWEDCFISRWNVTENSVKEDIFSPFTKKMEEKEWTKGELAMIDPKRPWTREQVEAVWPVLVFQPEYMREQIDPQKDVQSEQNPNAEWPSNTRFTNYKMYAYLVKHLDPQRPEVNWTAGSRNVFVFRLADTYLLAAEAAFLSGNIQKAAAYMNEIRHRAAIPGYEADMEVKPSEITIDFILDERARELMGEMHRWYDLKRTGKLVERMNDPNISPATAGKFKDYHVLRPIPRDQLTNVSNPTEFTQNPGYGN